MNKKIDFINIYSLNEFINSNYLEKEINEFFKKKNHQSKVSEFRPNSESWLKAKTIDDEIAKLPEHNVVLNYDKLTISYRYHKVEFDLGTITTEISDYCSITDEYRGQQETFNFLVENSHWGHGIICNFNDLLQHHKIKELLQIMFDDLRREKWEDIIMSFKDGVFILLLNKIIKAEEELIDVNLFVGSEPRIEIGEQTYYMTDMILINEAYKTGNYEFYDENDRKIVYKDYLYQSFPDFYLEHSKKQNI